MAKRSSGRSRGGGSSGVGKLLLYPLALAGGIYLGLQVYHSYSGDPGDAVDRPARSAGPGEEGGAVGDRSTHELREAAAPRSDAPEPSTEHPAAPAAPEAGTESGTTAPEARQPSPTDRPNGS